MLKEVLGLIGRSENHETKESSADRQRKPSYFKRAALLKGASGRVISGAKRRNEAAQERENAEHRASEASLAKSTRTVATFTRALVFVGLLSAFISFFQWREMNNSSEQIERAIGATNRQAKAMDVSNRAWISPRYIGIHRRRPSGFRDKG